MTLYERYNLNDDNADGASQGFYNAQTFTIGTTGTNENHTLTSVKLKLLRVGTPGTVTVAITATDGDGKPTGADLSTGTIDGDSLSTSAEWYEITMSNTTLSASTKYAIILKAINGVQWSSYVGWRGDATSPSYTGGSRCYTTDSGSSWTVYSSTDYMFEEYSTLGTNMQINIGDTWKDIETVQVNIGDTWKTANSVQVNIGDTWKTAFS